MKTSIKKLHHEQLVRGKGFPIWTQEIRICTLKGYVEDNLRKYGLRLKAKMSMKRAVEIEVQESIKRDAEACRQTEWAWTLQSPAVITADYPGKFEKLEAERAAIAAAPELENGETVEIDGEKYTVTLMGSEYSDPIKFRKI